jgi:hypothetical protein
VVRFKEVGFEVLTAVSKKTAIFILWNFDTIFFGHTEETIENLCQYRWSWSKNCVRSFPNAKREGYSSITFVFCFLVYFFG